MSWNRRRLATREGLDPARERWNGNSTKNNVSGTGAWIVDVMVGTLRILLGSIEGLIHPAQNGRDGGFDGDKEGEREPLQDLGRVLFIERLVPETGLNGSCFSFIRPRRQGCITRVFLTIFFSEKK